ncbi:MAG: hypothetical protein P8H88_05310 [Flavobacteriales bacterium]|nr:hypothetical protein [Flavobacteriales bacterium]
MEKFFNEINKYVISILLFLGGVGFLAKYLSGDALESQPVSMLLASLALIAVGIVAMPVVLEKLNQTLYKVLLAVGALAAAGLAYSVFYSVDEEIRFQETQKRINATTIQRLKDIRAAQESHLAVYGTFAETFDSLIRFVQAPVVPVEFNMGSFHDTLPEAQSHEEGFVIKRDDIAAIAEEEGMTEKELFDLITSDLSPYKVRDTLYTSFYAENLAPEARAAQRLPQVSLDSLAFNPYTGERFVMKTGAVEVGRVWQPTILVKDPTPFGRDKVKKDTLRFGSLMEAHRDGNWRN